MALAFDLSFLIPASSFELERRTNDALHDADFVQRLCGVNVEPWAELGAGRMWDCLMRLWVGWRFDVGSGRRECLVLKVITLPHGTSEIQQ